MEPTAERQYGNAYNLFILVLTVASLIVMALLWTPLNAQTIELLRAYDDFLCCVFVLDFLVAIRRAASVRAYVVERRGWLDLVGCVPSFGVPLLGLLRLARLNRLRSVSRGLGHQSRSQLIGDLLRNRAQYAILTTSLAALLVLASVSVVVLEAESRSAAGNIRTGADAFWWSMVSITTVGYGDYYPTTMVGRFAAMFLMVTGIGIIAALASVLGRLLVQPPINERDLGRKLDSVLAELTALRLRLDQVDRAHLGDVTDGPSGQSLQTPAPTPRSPDP